MDRPSQGERLLAAAPARSCRSCAPAEKCSRQQSRGTRNRSDRWRSMIDSCHVPQRSATSLLARALAIEGPPLWGLWGKFLRFVGEVQTFLKANPARFRDNFGPSGYRQRGEQFPIGQAERRQVISGKM